MKFVNVENFEDWLKEKSIYEINEDFLELSLQELWKQYCETDCAEYEMSKLETKTGVPEIYRYNVETVIEL